jgi:two-component system, NarL family, sensor histidine kinase UhpB
MRRTCVPGKPGFLKSWLEKTDRRPWMDGGDANLLDTLLGYGLAFVLVALALLVRQELERRLGPMPPFIVFIPTILVIAAYFGRGPGILATLLSVLAVGWYFAPDGSFAKTPINQIALVIFGSANIFLCALMDRLRRIRWMEAVSVTREQELEKLQRSELLLKASLESQKDTMLLSIDRDYRYLYFNTAHSKVMKQAYQTDIAVGMNILECMTLEHDRNAARGNYDRALRGESHTSVRTYGADESAYFESHLNPILDENNQVVGATAMSRDITQRLRDQEALRYSEERYRQLFEMESDTVLMLDWETGRFMEYNGAALRMYGYTKEEFGTIRHDDLSADPPVTRLSIRNKETTVPLRLHRKKDGTVFPVEIACSYFEYQGHQVLVAAIRDITERVRSDEHLLELNQKLYALNEHIQTVQELERIAIARDIHDDIGQDITVLKLDVEWILCRIPDAGPEVSERLREMRQSVDQLTCKVQRIAADLRPPLLDQMGLVAAVEWQVAEFGKRSGLECFMMLNEDIDPLEEQLATTVMRIVQEALTNIARHTGATEVSVSLCKKDGNLVLEISDNGCGITPEQVSSPKAYGMIGMQERARICRGTLVVGGESGSGTILQLTVPLSP